ncbi:MAG TPA: DUF2934 domain-containing protein [Xanthobacteraceae bacterium]|jgi:hypothetical protein
MNDLESRIRERAYHLWLQEGCPEHRADVHWDQARELVAIEDNQKSTTRPGPAPDSDPTTVEPLEAVENVGEFPTLTDQGEEQTYPHRRGKS